MRSKNMEAIMAKQVKSISERLPDRPATILVQADIDADLHQKVKAKMEKVRKHKLVTWKSLIEAGLEKWLEES